MVGDCESHLRRRRNTCSKGLAARALQGARMQGRSPVAVVAAADPRPAQSNGTFLHDVGFLAELRSSWLAALRKPLRWRAHHGGSRWALESARQARIRPGVGDASGSWNGGPSAVRLLWVIAGVRRWRGAHRRSDPRACPPPTFAQLASRRCCFAVRRSSRRREPDQIAADARAFKAHARLRGGGLAPGAGGLRRRIRSQLIQFRVALPSD